MVAICLLAGAHGSMRGSGLKGADQSVQLSVEPAEHGKEEEHGEEHAEHGKEGEEGAAKAGSLFAISFFAGVVLFAVVFAMSQASNKEVRNYTWFLIDQVIAVFLAVMYFQAFDSLLDFHGLPIHNAVVLAVLHAVLMLAMALALSYYLRGSEVGLAIVCGCGAHVVSFSSMHAGVHMQTHFMDVHFAWYTCIFGLAVLGLGFAFIGFLVYTAKKSANVIEDEGFMEKTDDLENDFGAMSFAVVLTMFARFCLTGHHPEGEEMEFEHTAYQRNVMLAYAVGCLIVAVFVVTFVSKKASEAEEADNYAVKRVYNFIKTVATMCVAWAFLYWGEMVFFETLFKDEMTGRVMFAIVSTVMGGLLLLLLSLRRPGSDISIFKSEQMVALTAISLVLAWSWELTFDFALEQLTEEDAHPATLKIGLTIFLFAVIVPVYALYVKPISGPAAEAIGA